MQPDPEQPAHVRVVLVDADDRVRESEPDTASLGPQFNEALQDFIKTWRAPEPRELGSRDEEVQQSASHALPGWVQLVYAIVEFKKTWVAATEPVTVWRRRRRMGLGSSASRLG